MEYGNLENYEKRIFATYSSPTVINTEVGWARKQNELKTQKTHVHIWWRNN